MGTRVKRHGDDAAFVETYHSRINGIGQDGCNLGTRGDQEHYCGGIIKVVQARGTAAPMSQTRARGQSVGMNPRCAPGATIVGGIEAEIRGSPVTVTDLT